MTHFLGNGRIAVPCARMPQGKIPLQIDTGGNQVKFSFLLKIRALDPCSATVKFLSFSVFFLSFFFYSSISERTLPALYCPEKMKPDSAIQYFIEDR